MSVDLIEAVVQAGSVETSYVRAGQGAPVVLLTCRTTAALIEDPLFQGLAACFRVIVPALPADDVNAGNWLRDVIDGLGLLECGRVLLDMPHISDGLMASVVSALGQQEEH